MTSTPSIWPTHMTTRSVCSSSIVSMVTSRSVAVSPTLMVEMSPISPPASAMVLVSRASCPGRCSTRTRSTVSMTCSLMKVSVAK